MPQSELRLDEELEEVGRQGGRDYFRTMGLTPFADLDESLDGLLGEMRSILGGRLVGLYLYGSLVSGDFDRGSSDIDLLAVTSSGIDGEEFSRLQKMHADFAGKNREWDGRMEIAYVPAAALKTYKTRASEIAVISPGEPFHLKEAGNDWLINWWVVRGQGVALYGPPPATLIDPI
jgi:predicted nucleotidyltransferase